VNVTHTHTQSKLWHNHANLVTVETCVWLSYSFMQCGSLASNSDCDISGALCWCCLNSDFVVVATETRAPWPLGFDSITRSNRHTTTYTVDCRRCQFSSSYFDCVSGSDDIHYFYRLSLISYFVFTVVTSLAPGTVLTFHTSSFRSSFFYNPSFISITYIEVLEWSYNVSSHFTPEIFLHYLIYSAMYHVYADCLLFFH
jgi:hypothetical protein